MIEFKSELYKRAETIRSKSLVKTVKEILDAVDEEFWLSPCSTSGKFHPPEDQGEAGLIRHLVKATYVFGQTARRERFEDYELDAGMAATILHDIKKNGEPWGKDTDYRHGIIGAEFIKKFYFDDKTIKNIIVNAVRYHMAPWTTTISNDSMSQARKNPQVKIFTYEEMVNELEERTRSLFPSKVEKAVQDADYWASRQDMSFYPGKTIIYDDKKHDTPDEWVKELIIFNQHITKIGGKS